MLVNPSRSKPARPPSTRSPTDSLPISSRPPERAQVTFSGFVARLRRGEGFWAAKVLHTTSSKAYGTNTYLKCDSEDPFYKPTSMVIKWKVSSI